MIKVTNYSFIWNIITSIRFNFVDADYFKANYKIIESPEE